MSFFEVNNLSFSFTKISKELFSAFNFSMQKNKILVILGKSGSGKTTLLKIFAGLLNYQSGDIYLNGIRLLQPSEQLIPGNETITLVRQDFGLFPNHTVRENILYPVRKLHPEDQAMLLHQFIDILGLEGLQEKLPSQLSGGQQQRVAIAQALANQPSLILFDEPFSQLDFHLKLGLINNLKTILKHTQTTAILVLHDPQDALMLADQVMVLDKGNILQYDTPRKVYQKPISKDVALLFGRCNLVESKYINQEKGLYLIRYEDIEICSAKKAYWSAKLVSENYFGYKFLYKAQITARFFLNFESQKAIKKSEKNISLTWLKAWSFDRQKYVYP